MRLQKFRFSGSCARSGILRDATFVLVLAGLVLALGSAPASQAAASNIFISQNGGGSGTSCSDTLAVSWFNNSGNWGGGTAQIGPGTTVHLCAGTYSFPAGTTNALGFQGSGSSGNVITLKADGAVVITAPYWGTGNDGSPAVNVNGKSFITIDGQNQLTIQATANGTPFANRIDGSNGIISNGGSNVTIQNLTVSNMYVHTCTLPISNCTDEVGGSTGGISAWGSNLLIQHCTIHDAKDGIGANYPGGSVITNMTFQNNTIYNTDHGIEFGAGGTGSTVTNVIIKNNDIRDFQNWDDAAVNHHHDGIHQFAYNTGDVVVGYQVNGNYIHGDFGANINAAIYQESSTQTTGTYVFNNLIVDQSSVSHQGCGEICVINLGARIYNNTITAPTGHGSVGVNVYQPGAVIQNNVIFNIFEAVGVSGSATYANTTFDYNNYYGIGGNGWNLSGSFSAWKTSCSCDAHSTTGNPNLNASYQPTSASTSLIGQAFNLAGLLMTPLNIDKAGNPRPSVGMWDGGAYGYGAASSGSTTVQPPTGLTATVTVP